tara:strand:+ start:214 stop:603 length:390 start_codon:yes stop_codon:yes gene_type:complete
MSRPFKIVCVSGFFDPLHTGHIDYLRNARLLGDKLVVILNRDHQRNSRMVFNETDRKILIEAIRYVDEVVLCIDNDGSVCESLKSLKPDIFAKGVDASESEKKICLVHKIQIVTQVGRHIHLQDLLCSL